jgi:hypothetical protein
LRRRRWWIRRRRHPALPAASRRAPARA